MRKSVTLFFACLSSLAVAGDPKDEPQAPPAEETPAELPADEATEEVEVAEEDEGPTEEELAALEAEAAKAAAEEKERQAKAALEREAAKGEKHETLTTSKGRTFNKVTIRGVDAVGVRIFHEAGTARIKFAELPKKFQQRFGYDPDRAEELLKQEKDLESARERATLARLRAEAGLPPISRNTRPGTTRPSTTRPTTTRPTTTRPSTTKPSDEDAPAAADTPEISALKAQIAQLEAQIAQVKPVAEGFEDEASKIEDKVFENVGKSAGDPRLDQAKLAEAKKWRDKAEAEYEKISAARTQITKIKREIKKIERANR